jgi:hypothetical protein
LISGAKGCCSMWNLTEILDVNVGAEPGVVGKIPARMVRIFVDNDLVGVPEPAVDIGQVVGSYAEVEASKPEAGRAAAAQTPDMRRTKAAGEVSVLPGMVEMVVGVVGAGFVAYPVVFIDVWGVGMTGLVYEVTVRWRRSAVGRRNSVGRRSAMVWFGAMLGRRMRRRSPFARMASTTGMLLRGPREGDKRSDQE